MEKLEGLRETISLNKVVELEGVPVVRMEATIHSEENNQMDYIISVINHELYVDNLEYFREQIQNFKEVVSARENYLFDMYHPQEEEIVEEDGTESEQPIEGKPEEENSEV